MWNWLVLLIAGAIALFFGVGMTATGYSVEVGLIVFGAGLLVWSALLCVQARRHREQLRQLSAEGELTVDADDTGPR